MDNIEELLYKVIDDDYDLTDTDKNYLIISSFVLAKEKIIKKDIPNDRIYFDCANKAYISLIIELGNLIKNQLIEDGRSLDQTVSVELSNGYLYKGDKEELKKAIYYVHRLRDWLVHKDYKLEGNRLIIKPFSSDRYHPDKEYTIEIKISDIEKICKRSSIDFIFNLNHYPHKNHSLKGFNNVNIISKGQMRFLVRKDVGLVIPLTYQDDYTSTVTKLNNISERIIDKKSIPSRYKLIDMSDYSNGKLDYDSFHDILSIYKMMLRKGIQKDVAFIMAKTYSDGEKLLRGILKDLQLSEKTIERNNYYIAALYNYAVNVYAEKDKERPDPKYFDLNSFQIERIDNPEYHNMNNKLIKKVDSFNNYVESQKNNLNNGLPSLEHSRIILSMFSNLVNLYMDVIEKYLKRQKEIITSSIRNSIDHGNLLIDPISSELVFYDLEDNTKEANNNNSKIKICSNLDSFHSHIDEYRNGSREEYTLGRMISDLKQLTDDSSEISRFEESIKTVLELALEREIDLDTLTILDASKEVKNKLIEKTTNIIRTVK